MAFLIQVVLHVQVVSFNRLVTSMAMIDNDRRSALAASVDGGQMARSRVPSDTFPSPTATPLLAVDMGKRGDKPKAGIFLR